jgi:NAD+ synthase (glutamine-hydrolysing)
MEFRSPHSHGFLRVAACVAPVAIADPAANVAAVLALAAECAARGVALAVFPELALSGYAIEDLLLQDVLLDAAERAVAALVAGSAGLGTVLVVGVPLRHGGRVYNCAVVVQRGRLLGVVPKSYLPNYREFYERRHFAAGEAAGEAAEIALAGQVAPFGTDLLFAADDVAGFVLHVEICEDLWVPVPPSGEAALAGATVLANLSGSPITVGRAETRRMLCRSQSARCMAAYVYAAAGEGESTTDLSWDGQAMVHENGALLAEGERFSAAPHAVVADVDLDLLRQERARTGTFDDNRRHVRPQFRRVALRLTPDPAARGLLRPLERFPFVPSDPARLGEDCYEAYSIQVAGLAQRLRATGLRRVVIGVSGGLDSTHALLVAARAFDRLGLPRDGILAYSLPGFATGEAGRARGAALMAALGVSAAEIDIRPAARQMLADLGHPAASGQPAYDVTFENVQAGLRTDYLFRLANHQGALVVGTGDLSELALGWCTYGVGDQMSHYGVNSGVPKTLIQHLIRWVAASGQLPEAAAVLRDIVGAEISPELVPGEAVQSTEAAIGPYELQDFTLFHVLRYGFRPSKIAFLALMAWGDAEAGAWPAGYPQERRRAYPLGEIRRWMAVFLRRFFTTSQFKRSAMPNGPKVSAGGSLSPRGDWRAPSDGTAAAWLAELAEGVPEQGQDDAAASPATSPRRL